jgi:predicted anti-sigma-YlaC factor YlaD
VRAVHKDCDRACQWASADLDAELSAFERVLLEGHLSACPSCREFSAGIDASTTMLRAAPHEPLERAVEITRRRRRLSLRLAPAAAAMAIAAVGLGSILASSQFQSGSVGRASLSTEQANAVAIPDTMDLRTAQVFQRNAAVKARLASRTVGSLAGGPVVLER